MATRSKLAVIVHADVVGSTTLVQTDEQVAHERIHRAFGRFSEIIVRYDGTAHEVRGDALVAEFNRSSDAVAAGLAFQAANCASNQALSGDTIRAEVRIGIALGEVVIADKTVTGAGVVLAQRLEQLAEPGGICVQGSAKELIPKRFPFEYEDLGARSLKGFDEPVRAFSVALKADAQVPSPDPVPSKSEDRQRPKRRRLTGGVVALVLVTAGLITWLEPWNEKPESSDQPSIAVLAFSNMSNDPEQDYFADGIAEDIITDLSKISHLLVIARNSSFSYKDKNVSVKEIAQQLGVKYVLEGSVRRAGKTLRITAQLIDTSTEGHLWAERYDGAVEDVFGLQDDISRKIISALAVKLAPTAEAAIHATETTRPAAHDAFLRGRRYLNVRSRGRAEDIAKAREEFVRAIELDPGYAAAYSGLGWTYWDDFSRYNRLDVGLKDIAFELADKSLALGENSLAHRLRSKRYLAPETTGSMAGSIYRPKEHDLALAELEKAVSLEPGNADAHAELAYALAFSGEAAKSVDAIEKAKRLNPNFPVWYYRPAGIALYFTQEYERAIHELSAWRESESMHMEPVVWLAAAYAQAGEIDRAHQVVKDFLDSRYDGGSTLAIYWQRFQYMYVFKDGIDADRFIDGVKKSGWADADD